MRTLLTMILLAALPSGLDGKGVKMDSGVEFAGLVAPVEVEPGKTARLELYFEVKESLGPQWYVFTHVERAKPEFRRIAHDRPPPAPQGGVVAHLIEVPVPSDMPPGRYEVYAGFWNTKTDERLRVIDPPAAEDRIHAGHIDIVASGAGDSTRSFALADMKAAKLWLRVGPWVKWIVALALSCIVLVVVGRRRSPEPMVMLPGSNPWLWGGVALACVPLFATILVALDFVKDDAYISFRYAHNLVTGHGLVFNPGDRLEGFTNFLWTLVLAPFEALGWDLFQVSEVLGTALCVGVVALMTMIAVRMGGARKSLTHAWAAVWISTSSSMCLWATSGMEQPLAMVLPLGALLSQWRAEDRGCIKGMAVAGILAALGCMTRPELHLVAAIYGASVLFAVVTRKIGWKMLVAWSAGLLALVVPFHAFRYLYYGSLLPNTFYVKTGASTQLMLNGLDLVRDMFSFNATGVLVVLAPLALLSRRHLRHKLACLAVALGFILYIVKVGVDEMHWHRLYLPALPLLALMAGMGLQALADRAARLLPSRLALAPIAAGWLLVGAGATADFVYTYGQMGGFNGRGDLAGTFHPDIGKFLTRHERPGALVAFQDMGSTPYHAPDLRFFDFIGLTEGQVARARHALGLNAYAATEHYRNQAKFDAQMRDLFFERAPEWAILTVYVPEAQMQEVARRFELDPGPQAMMGNQHTNSYQYQITKDPRFEANYVHVRTWPRSRTYYLMLFRRKDLWDKVPGEVVLDGAPEGIEGPRAKLEGGLELLGSQVDGEAIERHEAFVTTWWKAPGPMAADLLVFLHVEKEGFRTTLDHPPGDWMWPADRWRAGDVVEDRVLFQLPVAMAPGEYEIFTGVWLRSTGKRLAVTQGPNDGGDRIPLGTLLVVPLVTPWHQTIPPTDMAEQRKYPDRIIDS